MRVEDIGPASGADEFHPVAGFCAWLRRTGGRWTGALDRAALERAEADGRVSYAALWTGQVLPGEDLADAVAAFHGLPRIKAETLALQPETIADLSLRFLKEAWILPFRDGSDLVLAVADPTESGAIRDVGLALGGAPLVFVAAFDELAMLFEQSLALGAERDTVPLEDGDSEIGSAADEDLQRLRELSSGTPVIRMVDELLEAAVSLGATDIHIEPQREGARVRLRVDGMLRQHRFLSAPLARGVVSRVKILSGLNIAERRLPQDGRARFGFGSGEVDLRVATMPALHGENLVIRLLAKSGSVLDFARLGMRSADMERFEAQLRQPHGLVVVAGPTGSGKTTTLAAALSALNSPDRKIVTIEDPIEYQIPGVNQTQAKPEIDLTFANALRAFLRHDPDIIMVGEMRDRDTASIGVQAALTGHLVLTTLHTNSAADAIVRLTDLGVEPFLIDSALRCVIGQRLLRKLCERCRRPLAATPAAAGEIRRRYGFSAPDRETFFAPGGCAHCAQTGYRGRIGIFEVLSLDEGMRRLVRSGIDPSKILALALAGGMTTMLQDGLDKAAAGITTVEEVLRAVV